MIPFHVHRLKGIWRWGWALDVHTVQSRRLPDGKLDTQRTPLGERLYQLKYHNDISQISPIAEVVSYFIRTQVKVYAYLSAIIPVPPSNPDRPFQPVQELALEVGRRVEIPVATDYLKKIKKTPPLKDVDDTQSRKRHLRGAFVVADRRFAGKYVLVLDDLYRSGETLSEVTRVLMQQGKVSKVFVLTITKTRTKR